MDDCTRIDDHCELLRESPRQWYLSYNSYCMSFARLCKRQNYRTQEYDDKQKKPPPMRRRLVYYIPIFSRYGIAARILSHSQLLRGLRSCFLMNFFISAEVSAPSPMAAKISLAPSHFMAFRVSESISRPPSNGCINLSLQNGR